MNSIVIEKPTPKTRRIAILCLILAILLTAGYLVYRVRDLSRVHYAKDFRFEDIKSSLDADGDGTEDFADLVAGALAYIATDPEYRSGYYAGGYPPEGEGVCTDVIWHAMEAAGYCLKDLVDGDIRRNPEAYPDHSDANIDFRRVRNLKVFFERNAISLPVSLADPKDWMPGDIVVFDGHIGLCSDKRNAKGIPYLIHHGNNVTRAHEGDDIGLLTVVGHYRWEPSA